MSVDDFNEQDIGSVIAEELLKLKKYLVGELKGKD